MRYNISVISIKNPDLYNETFIKEIGLIVWLLINV